MRTLLLFNFPKESELRDEILIDFDEHSNMEIVSVETPLEATQFLINNDNVVFLFHAYNKMDLTQSVVVLKKIKHRVISKKVFPMAITNTKDRTFTEMIKNQNCTTLYSKEISSEKLLNKINNVTKVKASPPVIQGDDTITIKNGEKSESSLQVVIDAGAQPQFEEEIGGLRQIEDINLEAGTLEVGIKCNSVQGACNLEHFTQDHIECEILDPNLPLETEASVELSIIFQYEKCKIELNLDGVISEIENTESTSRLITIHLNESETVGLENFMVLFQKRQKSIHEFMQLARGFAS